jgi:hypothetical protein
MDTASGNNKICERSNPEMCVMLYSTAPKRGTGPLQACTFPGCARSQAAFVARFHEFMHEGGRGREGDAVALLAGS